MRLSWRKMYRGLKACKFTPSKWLRTDRVILNTVRRSSAYLCAMGIIWADVYGIGDVLDSFFSKEMKGSREILQFVEWDTSTVNDGCESLSIHGIGGLNAGRLSEEMTTAFGANDTRYDVRDTSILDA